MWGAFEMAVVVEVPDEATSRRARRLIGRRSGVTVVVSGNGNGHNSSNGNGSEPHRRIIVTPNANAPASSIELLHEGVWAVVPADADSVDRLLKDYVDDVRTGLCPLLSKISQDRDEIAALLGALQEQSAVSPAAARENPLSERETQILQEIAKGATNQEIADDMGYQLQSVKNRATTIMTKVHARSRTHAVSIALKNGWIKL